MTPEITPEYLASQGLSETFPQRFWAKVRKTDSCWLWAGAMFKGGYGQIRPGGKKQCVHANRAAWILLRGPIPDGMWVLHNCPGGDNPACVNPDHLWLGTAAENTADMISKGRLVKPFCHRGEERYNHKLTWDSAARLRELYASGKFSQRQLARMFGIGHTATRFCLIGKTWIR